MTQQVQPDTASTAITTTYGYDAAGNKTRFTDGRHNSWVYTVNSWNMVESEIEPATATYSTAADRTFTMVYDAAGRPTRQALPGGVAVTAGYDAAGQLKSQAGTGAEAASADRSLDYDAAGRVKSANTAAAGTAPATAESFTYNDRGLLLTATGTAGNSSFSYTADGLPSSRTDAAGATTYGYDTAGRLATLNDPATGTAMSYGYNTLNQVRSISYGSAGNQRVFDYDSTHRVKADTLKTAAGAVVASVAYGYDANDNLTSKTTTGFAGATANTYTYDLANRLTSWTAGTATVAYGYDASGNRTQVGANVYTYDARDQLTSDGTTTYHYTARGTVDSQTSASGTLSSTVDAYGQTITQGTQTYGYDASGRLLSVKPTSGTATQLSYTGTGNDLASDGTTTYTHNPSGGVVGIGTPGTSGGGVLAYTDLHNDVVGDFTATGTSLAGSTAYDPLGNVLATSNQAGHLGYQSGWTDPATKRVNMAARWYNPATGQFTSRDTVEQAAAPNSANFNPFAYAADNPMTGADPSGHGWWSTVKSWGSSAWHATVSAWHYTTHFVSTYIFHPIASAARSAWSWAARTYRTAVNRMLDALDRQIAALQRRWQQVQAHIRAVNKEIKRRAKQAAHVVSTAYHKTAHAVTTAATFVKHHAAAIGAFVVSTAVFMGCEAVLGAATGGVGAVAGAVACGALAGAAGGLFEQGAKCFDGQKGACSTGSFVKAGLIGGAVGGLAGLGGALGGKVLSAVGGKALRAVGGLFGRGGAEAAEGAAEGVAIDGASSAVDTAADSVAEGAAGSGARDAGEAAAPRGGEVPRGRSPSSDQPTEQPRAGEEPAGSSCHSFTGSTPVLLATGRTKPIDQVKVGDKITNAVPGDSGDRTHTVQAVIVTKTDHDFVDVTVAPGARTADPVRQPGRLARAAMTTAAAVAAVAAALVPAHGGTLTTTFQHPFYDRTQAAFVDAKDLRVGDELQTPDGGAATVTGVRLYHTTQTTYDLTVGGLHTYYVEAGSTPVLVHNCTTTPSSSAPQGSRGPVGRFQPTVRIHDPEGPWTVESRVSDGNALRNEAGMPQTTGRLRTWTSAINLRTGQIAVACSGGGNCAETNILAHTGWDLADVLFNRAAAYTRVGGRLVWDEQPVCQTCQSIIPEENFVPGILFASG
jgi:RHS repeat-associated protein